MTFSTPTGVTIGSSTANSFSLAPHAAGDFILLGVLAGFTAGSTASYATSISNSGNITWTVLVAHTAFSSNTGVETLFIGKVNSTGAATQTIGFNTGSPVCRTAWQEFSNTLGYSAVTLDASGTTDTLSGGSFPSVTVSHGAGELYWGYLWDNGTGSAGSTSGFTYQFDANGNPMAYNASCGTGAQHPNIGDTSDGTSGIAVLLYEAVTTLSGAANLSGSGVLSAGDAVTQPAAAALSGTGTVTPGGTASTQASAALSGEGALTAGAATVMPGQGSANLSGSGALGVARNVAYQQAVPLSGTGAVGLAETGIIQQAVPLYGSGTLAVAGAAALKFTAGLFGAGFLSIPQVAGGLVNGTGGAATPQALPGSSQVAVAPPGSSNWQWLGTLGQVTALTYSYVCPGGADKMSMTIMCPAAFRTQLFNPGWQVRITRGGHQVWDGKLDEPQPTAQGWNLTAVGTGNLGANFTDFYAPGASWPTGVADDILNRAIARGLPWVNPGMAASPYYSQFWFGQQTDPGSTTVTAFLNLICTRGGLVWYVNSQPGGIYGGDNLSVFPLPTVPNRLLVATTPVARTLGGYVNSIFVRYPASADNPTATPPVAASYNVVSVVNQQSVAAHGTLEAYLDLSNAPVMTAAQAQSVASSILQIYQAASFAGPFTVSYGQLLNVGGQPVDIGCDQAGSVCQLVLTDFAYGGQVAPGAQPITFCVGSYSYDDMAQIATITPYQSVEESLSGLLSLAGTTMTPLTIGG